MQSLQGVFEGSLKGVLEGIQESILSWYPHDFGWLNHIISFSREKEKKGENYHKACVGTMSYDRSPLIYRHLVCVLFIKIFIIRFISTNIDRPYMGYLIPCNLQMKLYDY